MAKIKFTIGQITTQVENVETAWELNAYVCDTYAERPVTGLNTGDILWAKDTTSLSVADSATTWATLVRTNAENTFTAAQSFVDSIFFVNAAGTIESIFEPGATANRAWGMPDVSCSLTGCGFGADPPDAGYMGKVNRLAQAAAIASTNLTNATIAGLYRVSYYLRCTTADVTAGTISASFTFTDNVGATTETSATVALTSTVNRAQGSFVAYLASGNITYLTTLIGIAGSSQYQLRARCEFLG